MNQSTEALASARFQYRVWFCVLPPPNIYPASHLCLVMYNHHSGLNIFLCKTYRGNREKKSHSFVFAKHCLSFYSGVYCCIHGLYQCCGSGPFFPGSGYGSGSADPFFKFGSVWPKKAGSDRIRIRILLRYVLDV